jgi:hypothetical protein
MYRQRIFVAAAAGDVRGRGPHQQGQTDHEDIRDMEDITLAQQFEAKLLDYAQAR